MVRVALCPFVSQSKAIKRFLPGASLEGYDRVLQAREARGAVCSNCYNYYAEFFIDVGQPLLGIVRVLSEFISWARFPWSLVRSVISIQF